MQEARIVIGANFGDEGKGLMTDFFAREYMEKYGRCLVSCTNGGSQKGHTVISKDRKRHVFHHFGSGNFVGADTYLTRFFIVNPIIFNREYDELLQKKALTRTFIDKRCRVTLPIDMMINQLIEEKRGSGKHGSCGFGIFETICRSKELSITVEDLLYLERDNITRFNGRINNITFESIKEYINKRMDFLGIDIDKENENWKEAFDNVDEILERFIDDVRAFLNCIIITDEEVLQKYEGVVFEASQGLMLDMDNVEYMPHLTPSNTGIKNPATIIGDYKEDNKEDVDSVCCYVTRSYMTRHGAGRFDTECSKDMINAYMYDKTNVPNPYQDTLRYGMLDVANLKKRIKNDVDINGGKINPEIRLAVTHINEYAESLANINDYFNDLQIYESYSEQAWLTK